MEKTGHFPLLTNAARAKAMMDKINKTDKPDSRGLAALLRSGTLPSVWIPPAELRGKRELSRTSMALVRMRTMIKNRVQAILSKYALHMDETSDIFGLMALQVLENKARELPPFTRECLVKELELLDEVVKRVHQSKAEMKLMMAETEEIKLLPAIPGVGFILTVVIATK